MRRRIARAAAAVGLVRIAWALGYRPKPSRVLARNTKAGMATALLLQVHGNHPNPTDALIDTYHLLSPDPEDEE
jgi:hypothetical protein